MGWASFRGRIQVVVFFFFFYIVLRVCVCVCSQHHHRHHHGIHTCTWYVYHETFFRSQRKRRFRLIRIIIFVIIERHTRPPWKRSRPEARKIRLKILIFAWCGKDSSTDTSSFVCTTAVLYGLRSFNFGVVRTACHTHNVRPPCLLRELIKITRVFEQHACLSYSQRCVSSTTTDCGRHWGNKCRVVSCSIKDRRKKKKTRRRENRIVQFSFFYRCHFVLLTVCLYASKRCDIFFVHLFLRTPWVCLRAGRTRPPAITLHQLLLQRPAAPSACIFILGSSCFFCASSVS